MNINYDYIENYIASFYKPKTSKQEEMLKFARAKNVPIVTDSTALFLEFMCAYKKPNRILEIGTAIGYSAILMQKSSDSNCEVITLEKDEKMYNKAIKNIDEMDLKDNIKVIYGDAKDTLLLLNDEFDLIFLDAAKGQYQEFFIQCLKLLKQGGIIICDNVLFRGMIANDELVSKKYKTLVNKMRMFLNDVMGDKSLNASILPVGDGILVCTKGETKI